MHRFQNIFKIYKETKWIHKLVKFFFLFFLIILVFFYSFWFSLSEEKIKDFLIGSFPQQNIAITAIEKQWCSIEIQQFQYGEFPVFNIKAHFCSFSLVFLQKIPITLYFAKGNEIYASFPILAKQGEARLSPDFQWNELPIISNYLPVRNKPFYDLLIKYTKDNPPNITVEFQAKDFLLDNENIQPDFLQGFIPPNIKLDDLTMQVEAKNKRIDVKLNSTGFFVGNVVGVISRNNNFLQSKISFKISGTFKSLEQFNPLVKNYLKPYLKNKALQMKIGGILAQPVAEKI